MEHENADRVGAALSKNTSPTGALNVDSGGSSQMELKELRQRIDALEAKLTERAASPKSEWHDDPFEPDLDVYENDREFLIHAALPGAEPDRIHVEATAHAVTLTADIVAGKPRADLASSLSVAKRHRRSRHADHNRYHFVYTFHATIDPKAARAELQNGIVEIHLPKVDGVAASVVIPVALVGEHRGGIPERVTPLTSQTDSQPSAHAGEGNPGHKLGAAYVASASEDHTSKAEAVGEKSAPGRIPIRTNRIRTAETTNYTPPPSLAEDKAQSEHS